MEISRRAVKSGRKHTLAGQMTGRYRWVCKYDSVKDIWVSFGPKTERDPIPDLDDGMVFLGSIVKLQRGDYGDAQSLVPVNI